MKKLIVLAFIISSFSVSAQSKAWILCTSGNAYITTADSLKMTATLTAIPGLFSGIKWTQPATQQANITSQSTSYLTSVSGTTTLTIKNLPVGTYLFTATGSSADGASNSYTDTVFVTAAPLRAIYSITVYSDSTRKTTSF